MPILIELKGCSVVIIGGGKVALRRAEKFLRYGARVTIVSPDLEVISGAAEHILWIRDQYKKDYILDADFVVAATNDREINNLVSIHCKELKRLCNRVDQSELSDVIVPMSIQKGNLSVAVSTNGQSPLYAKELVEKIETLIEPDIEEKLELLGALREKILESNDFDIVEKHARLEQIITMDIASLRKILER